MVRAAAGATVLGRRGDSPALIAAVRVAAPRGLPVGTALLGRLTDRPTALVRRAVDAGHDEVHPHVAALLAEPRVVARAHAVGVAVLSWTVNRDLALRRLRELGVDGAITDVPASARRALGAPSRCDGVTSAARAGRRPSRPAAAGTGLWRSPLEPGGARGPDSGSAAPFWAQPHVSDACGTSRSPFTGRSPRIRPPVSDDWDCSSRQRVRCFHRDLRFRLHLCPRT